MHDSNLRFTCDNAGIIKSIKQLGQFSSNPCQNELESRMTIVDILKQTRGVSNWNGPDDKGTGFNWSSELPLGEWDGIAPEYTPPQKRIQVDGSGKIRILLLNHLGMRGIMPDSIGNLASLNQFSVSHNRLTHLPDSIGQLSSLIALWADTNQLTHIPDSIGNLASLALLYANDNQLSTIPVSFCNLKSLAQLTLHSNQLTALPDTFGNLTSLTGLWVHTNQLSALPDSIGNLSSLTKLYVGLNQLTRIPDTIGNLKSLTDLYVNSNQLSQLPDWIRNLTSLTTLYVHTNPVTSTQSGKDEAKRRFGRDGLKIYVEEIYNLMQYL